MNQTDERKERILIALAQTGLNVMNPTDEQRQAIKQLRDRWTRRRLTDRVAFQIGRWAVFAAAAALAVAAFYLVARALGRL